MRRFGRAEAAFLHAAGQLVAWETRAFFRAPDGHLLEISEARTGA